MTAVQTQIPVQPVVPNATEAAGLFDRVWDRDMYRGFSRNTRGENATPFLDGFIRSVMQRTPTLPRVVELGAGSCDHALKMAHSGCHVTAVEYSHAATVMGEQRLCCHPELKMTIVEQDLLDYTLSLSSDTLDGMYANSVFHFLTGEERNAVYRRCRVALKFGGIIGISFKAWGDALQSRGMCVTETPMGPIVCGEDGIKRLFVSQIDPLVQEMRDAGFDGVEVVRWSVPDYNIMNEQGEFVGIMGHCVK